MKRMTVMLLILASSLAILPKSAPAQTRMKTSGELSGEMRNFVESPLSPDQHGDNLSLAFEPQLYLEWDGRRQGFEAIGFLRLDQSDNRRTHLDLRELSWTYAARDWEAKLGISKEYWGQTESLHLVDVINQTDAVENPDGEDKLGQPMVNLSLIRDWGTIDLFALSGFRERSFPGRSGRLRFPLPVDTDQPRYEAADQERHIDWAIRYAQTLGPLDLGLSHFAGTSREARLQPGTDRNGRAVLIPHYDLEDQTGLDALAALGGWLWKFEAISRSSRGHRHHAMAGGFEYTIGAIFQSGADVGLLAEYLWDERGDQATTPFQDDVFVGSRLALNNISATDVLAGLIIDLGNGTNTFLIESTTRLFEGWKIGVEARGSFNADPNDPLYAFRRDTFLQTTLIRYF